MEEKADDKKKPKVEEKADDKKKPKLEDWENDEIKMGPRGGITGKANNMWNYDTKKHNGRGVLYGKKPQTLTQSRNRYVAYSNKDNGPMETIPGPTNNMWDYSYPSSGVGYSPDGFKKMMEQNKTDTAAEEAAEEAARKAKEAAEALEKKNKRNYQ